MSQSEIRKDFITARKIILENNFVIDTGLAKQTKRFKSDPTEKAEILIAEVRYLIIEFQKYYLNIFS